MENCCYRIRGIGLFAYHYKTNEMIPIELVQKSRKAQLSRRNGNHAPVEFWYVRHGMARTRPSNIKDIKAFETAQFSKHNCFLM
jgi:peptidyl-dipeptidase Dcp